MARLVKKMSVQLANSKKTGLLRKHRKEDETIETITEQQLIEKDVVTPEDVIKLNKITDCKLKRGRESGQVKK